MTKGVRLQRTGFTLTRRPHVLTARKIALRKAYFLDVA